MRSLISAQKAAKFIFSIFGSLILIHIMVISKTLPFTIFWSDQLQAESLLPLELITLVFLLSFSLIVLIKLKYLKNKQANNMINIGLWFVVIYYLINSFTSFSSGYQIVNILLGILYLSISFLSIRLAIEK